MRKGFTLIELLVAVLIIGTLAAVALPQYQIAVKKARFARLLPLQTAIYNAEKVYFLTNGKYTNDFEMLDIEVPFGGVLTSGGRDGVANIINYDNLNIILYATANGSNVGDVVCISGVADSYEVSTCRYFNNPRWDCRAPIGDKILGKVCENLGAVYKDNDGTTDMYYFQ